LGCDDNVEGVVQLDGMDMVAVENNTNNISAITPEMIEKSVRHVHTAKAQRQCLHDCVADSRLDINNNASHVKKHYVFICDYVQNIELPFLGDQQPGETYYLTPKSVHVFGMVDMAHLYDDVVESTGEHLHTHVYPERRATKEVTMLLR